MKTIAPDRWAQIEELFHRAAECDPQQRRALLDQACGNDAELREKVEALLAADRGAESYVHEAVRSELGAFGFPLVGETVSHYRILEGLGGGGMGLVYRAEDIKLGRQVAIKFLPEESAKDPASLGRFEREARSASALEHPNICPIYEFGEHEGRPLLAMQLLEGQTLREVIATSKSENAPFPIRTLLDLAIQILNGLEAAHQKAIVHRDIKPVNIFITKQGEAKILDFGLAKLTQSAAAADESAEADKAQAATGSLAAPNLFLSRTGVAMGTAGYMSPEQVRGEKLDARTDLFSFGLVLYEMATGKRAFAGDTGPQLQEAILNQAPPAPREVNPAVPPKLEKIINRAIEKNRDARYQSASEIRAELDALRRATDHRRSRRWASAAVVIALCLAVLSAWLVRRQQQALAPLPEMKLRQLTANSPENHVNSGMISPDGTYLAYSDQRGMHLKNIETGEAHAIAAPQTAENQKMDFTIASWSPDNSKVLVIASPAGFDAGAATEDEARKRGGVNIWEVSVPSGASRMLRSMAVAYSYSPDGSLIAFARNKGRLGPRELWLMDANGEHARKLLDTGDESFVGGAWWSRDGQKIIYVTDNGHEITRLALDLKGGLPITLEPPVFWKDVGNGMELPDGRTILAAKESGTFGSETCNFWILRNDPRTGKLVEKPRRITNWTGFCMDPTSVTADGKKLAFLQMSGHATVYVADLQSRETRISNLRHFTLTDTWSWPGDWTPDSKALIFLSTGGGHDEIYRQSLNGDAPDLLVQDSRGLGVPKVSPDGKWILFVVRPNEPLAQSAGYQLMRVPMTGGTPQPVFALRDRLWWEPNCARSPSICVVFERTEDRKAVIVTAFDPLKGRGAELARIATDPSITNWSAHLSPDGARITLVTGTSDQLRIFSVRGELIKEIKVNGPSGLVSAPWAPDGKALFVSGRVPGGYVLLRVGLDGQIQPMIENHAPDVMFGLPSPDGRHLAIMAVTDNNNMWMTENF